MFCVFPPKQRLSNQVLAVHAIPVIVQDEDDVDDVVPGGHPHVVEPHEPNFMPNPNVIISSRPSSQLSQNGSSGYGSTRSQVGPFGTSNRPSPSASSSSSSSDNNSNNNNNNQTKPKKKRSVWFGGSLRGRASMAASNSESSEQILEAGSTSGATTTAAVTSEIKTRGQPQYASLRIPNRIQAASTFEDRGLDLAEAEVDSDTEANNNNKNGGQNSEPLITTAHNGYYPLRNG